MAKAVDLLQVGRIVKVEGQPDEEVLAITPSDIVRILEVAQKMQNDILGDPSEDRVAEVHLHFNPYDKTLPVPVDGVEPPLIDGDEEEEDPALLKRARIEERRNSQKTSSS
jgi:hypothetical protein